MMRLQSPICTPTVTGDAQAMTGSYLSQAVQHLLPFAVPRRGFGLGGLTSEAGTWRLHFGSYGASASAAGG